MNGRFPGPHIWSPAYGRPPPQPHNAYPMLLEGPYGVQTMGASSSYPGAGMPFQPRPPASLSQCLGLPRSMPGGVQKAQGLNAPLPDGVEKQEDGSVFCKNCDKKFPDISQFRAHEAHHRKCDVDGCSFMGTQRAVNIHREEKHSAVSSMVPVLETPEQIAKWREARRKNFPTTENVSRKKEAQRQRHERGQVAQNELHQSRNGFGARGGQRQRNKHPHQRQSYSDRPDQHQKKQHVQHSAVRTDGIAPEPQAKRPCPFNTSSGSPSTGTSDTLAAATPRVLLAGAELTSAAEAAPSASVSTPTAVSPANRSGLGLLGSYGSDEDSSDNDEDSASSTLVKRSPESSTPQLGGGSTDAACDSTIASSDATGPLAESAAPDSISDEGSVGPLLESAAPDTVSDDGSVLDESAVLSALLADAGRLQPLATEPVVPNPSQWAEGGVTAHDGRQHGRQRQPRRQKQRNKNPRHQAPAPAPSPPKPGLLEKLLAGEVRRERNILLQCIRHIVREDFFDQHPRLPPSSQQH
ncbi:FMR1-interacting protein NUFIP1-like [Sycon ciliatum]|uniref:FMR1-interacting protein NUFIP1-like n=1 Tax=Sycon ciliatum TaxID=27933 RepID=UPI0020A97EDC|eukprot:scpid41111/ scgid35089/ Nuclear fragile X mental retardation-interacting protein 1; Nuclear FMRP-interacting protein 1